MTLYIFDANALIHIWRVHPPDIYSQFWRQLDDAIAAGIIRSPEEVLHELSEGTDDLAKILSEKAGLFAPLDSDLIAATMAVLHDCPSLVDPDSERNRADPFVVALAKLRGGTVVTMEKRRRPPSTRLKIPDACEQLGVPWVDWFSYLRASGWQL